MELSNKDTKMLQGLSVIAMLCLHLFSRSYVDLYQPLVFIKGTPLSFLFSQLSDFCVFGFAFCSGYGHMKIFDQPNYYKRRLKSLLILLINFWLILILATVVSVIIGQAKFMPGSVWDFLGTAFLYDMHYNGAWWYMWAYVLLVLISPLVLRAFKRFPAIPVLAVSFLIYIVAFYVRFYMPEDNYFYYHFGAFGMTFFEYAAGCAVAKTMLFTKMSSVQKKIPLPVKISGCCLVLLFLLYARTFLIPNVFFAPLSGFIIISMFALWKKPKWVESTFVFFGKHSTNMWLTHMFFVSSLWIYVAKYPIAIFLLLIAITLLISFAVSFVMKRITGLLNKAVKI